MAARAGVEPTTLRLRVIDLTNAPPRPTSAGYNMYECVLELGFIHELGVVKYAHHYIGLHYCKDVDRKHLRVGCVWGLPLNLDVFFIHFTLL